MPHSVRHPAEGSEVAFASIGRLLVGCSQAEQEFARSVYFTSKELSSYAWNDSQLGSSAAKAEKQADLHGMRQLERWQIVAGLVAREEADRKLIERFHNRAKEIFAARNDVAHRFVGFEKETGGASLTVRCTVYEVDPEDTIMWQAFTSALKDHNADPGGKGAKVSLPRRPRPVTYTIKALNDLASEIEDLGDEMGRLISRLSAQIMHSQMHRNANLGG